nr:apical junction molecule-like isoform X1 [Halyomorpha halys]
MPSVSSRCSSFINQTTNRPMSRQVNKTSGPVVANAEQRNKMEKRGMDLMDRINKDTEEHKKTMWERFKENERKKREKLFESSNPRHTLPSPYLKTLEEASLIRQNFKHCVVVSGVTVKSRRVVIKEPSQGSLELRPHLSCTDLTNLPNVEKPCHESSDISFLTANSLKLNNRDAVSQAEIQTNLKSFEKRVNISRGSSERSHQSSFTTACGFKIDERESISEEKLEAISRQELEAISRQELEAMSREELEAMLRQELKAISQQELEAMSRQELEAMSRQELEATLQGQRDVEWLDEDQVLQSHEYRQLPGTSTKPSSNEEGEGVSKTNPSKKDKISEQMEQKFKENEAADEQEIKHNQIIIVSYYLSDENNPEDKKVTFSLLHDPENESDAIPDDDDDNKSEKSQLSERTHQDLASTSKKVTKPSEKNIEPEVMKFRQGNSPSSSKVSFHEGSWTSYPMLKMGQCTTKHASSVTETISGSDSTLHHVDIPDRKRTNSLFKRFLNKLSLNDRKSAEVRKYINHELEAEEPASAEASRKNKPEEQDHPSPNIVKRAWDSAKKFSTLGLAAPLQDKVTRKRSTLSNTSKDDV